MVFNFYKNTSDNRKVNKELEKILISTTQTKIVDENIIPRYGAANAKITASSTPNVNRYPDWAAFNYYHNGDWYNPDWDTCWTADMSDLTPWIMYEFDNATYFDKVIILCGSYSANDYTVTCIVQGSNDGLNFTNLHTVELTAPAHNSTTINFSFDNNIAYKYFRLQFETPLLTNNDSFLIDDIKVDGFHFVTTYNYDVNVIYKDDETKDNPTLEIAYTEALEHANYAYCVDTGYYFYLSEPTLSSQRLFFNCEVDLLMTYKADILELGCILSRQENTFNTYIKDNQQAILSKRVVDTRIAPHGFNTNDQFILATCGK